MSIKLIVFRRDVVVNVGGDLTTIESWNAQKHSKMLEPEMLGNGGVHLWTLDRDGKRTNNRKHLPATSIAYIDEDVAVKVEGKKP